MSTTKKLAVLIDADNISADVIEYLLLEINKFGIASVKRIYGDWTKPQLSGWKNVLLNYSIQPIQQFAYTTGKNATDACMIIDAMDLLYTGRFEGFCLVTSDSDYTRLAQRIREQGLCVFGFGKQQTPKSFMQACDRFTYLEMLDNSKPSAEVDFYDSADMLFSMEQNQFKPIDVAITMVKMAIINVADDAGWAHLAPVKNHLLKIEPDFDTRLFGFSKFSDFLRAYPRHFDIEERYPNNDHHKAIFVRNRS